MSRYPKIILSFMRYGLIAAMEYRFNFFLWAIVSLVWATLFIYATDLIFGQVSSIAGWTKNEALILVATLTLFVGFMWLFIFPNLNRFSVLIRKGQLDFYLLKPLNSRFLVSCREFQYDQFLRIIVVLAFIGFKLHEMHLQIGWTNIIGFGLALLMGLIIFYNLFFGLTITNFWLINVSNLEDFFHNLLDIGKFPTQIYKGAWTFVFSYVIPIFFVATFPVEILLGRANVDILWIGLALVVITTFASQWFWNFALKRYSSASS